MLGLVSSESYDVSYPVTSTDKIDSTRVYQTDTAVGANYGLVMGRSGA